MFPPSSLAAVKPCGRQALRPSSLAGRQALRPSSLAAISLSTLLGVTFVAAVSTFFSNHHSLLTTPNFGLFHLSSVSIYNYVAAESPLHYASSSSTDRRRAAPTHSRSPSTDRRRAAPTHSRSPSTDRRRAAPTNSQPFAIYRSPSCSPNSQPFAIYRSPPCSPNS